MNRKSVWAALLVAIAAGVGLWFLFARRPAATQLGAGGPASRTRDVGMSAPRSPLATPSRIRQPEKTAAPVALVPPGAKAFRKYTDGFVAQQAEATREHMAREQVTL